MKGYIYVTLGTFSDNHSFYNYIRSIMYSIMISFASYHRNLSSNAIAVLPDRVFASLTNLDIL